MWPYPPQKNSFLLQFCELFFKKEIRDRIPPFQKPVSPFGDFSWKNKGLSNLVSVIYLGENLPWFQVIQNKNQYFAKKFFFQWKLIKFWGILFLGACHHICVYKPFC